MTKIGLVLEGGGMRGLYTTGILDIFMDEKIPVDGIIGVSAGALFGVNYFSEQKGRVIRYNKKYAGDIRYISKLSFILTGNAINKHFAYYKMSKKIDKFDNDKFIKNNKEFYAVATNVDTGKAEYFKIDDPIKDMEILRATSALPLVSRMIKINNKKYLDGGCSDSIPIDKMMKLGYDKIIVVLTQIKDYRKSKTGKKTLNAIKLKYKKYPNFINVMENRHINYNNTLDKLFELEKQGKIFVIRPSYKVPIDMIEKNPNTMQKMYDLGIEDAKKYIKDIKEYLNCK